MVKKVKESFDYLEAVIREKENVKFLKDMNCYLTLNNHFSVVMPQ